MSTCMYCDDPVLMLRWTFWCWSWKCIGWQYAHGRKGCVHQKKAL